MHATATKSVNVRLSLAKDFRRGILRVRRRRNTHNPRALLSNPWESRIEAQSQKKDPNEPAFHFHSQHATQYIPPAFYRLPFFFIAIFLKNAYHRNLLEIER